MVYLIVFLLVAVALLHGYRQTVLYRRTHPIPALPFSGAVYRLGDVVVAHRDRPAQPTRTVVCMPGFMENISYYFDLYQDEDVDLILINNCFYHAPIADEGAIQPAWAKHNPYEPGTIEHDAFVMVQVLGHLPRTNNIVLHGHSRGGAVVLEAGRQMKAMKTIPSATQTDGLNYTALLEAPVLPQGKARGHEAPYLIRILMRYLMPLAFYAHRRNALAYLKVGGYRHPHTDVKAHIISQYFGNPKQYHITVTNIRSIDEWTRSTDFSIYDAYQQIVVMVPEKDIVLDRTVMFQCASSHDNVRVVEVDRADHFISLERPEYVRALVSRLHYEATIISGIPDSYRPAAAEMSGE